MADVTVALVDDDPLVRMALRTLLDGARDVRVVGEAGDGTEVAALLDRARPGVLVLDVRMPRMDGIETVRRIAARPDAPATVMLTTFESDANVLAAIRAGAVGFLLKHAPPESIVDAVRAAAAGEPAFGPSALRALVSHVGHSGTAEPAVLDELSPRERDVALRVARGLTNAEIGAEIHLSAGSVKAVVSAVLARTGLQNRTQLAIAAHRELG